MSKTTELVDDGWKRLRQLLLKVKILGIAALLLLGGAVWLFAIHRTGLRWEIAGEIGKFVALVLAIHLLEHFFVQGEERVLFLKDMRKAIGAELRPLGGLIKETRNAVEQDRAKVYEERDEMYHTIIKVIRRVDTTRTEKSLRLVGLHGGADGRLTEASSKNSAFKQFDEEMCKCVDSPGWYVREIYNISDEARLLMILQRIRRSGSAEGYEVRAFCIKDPIPQFKPLIVGREDLFLGIDDPTYYRVKAGFHLRGTKFVDLAAANFEDLWKDTRLFKLRTPTGEDSAEVQKLRDKIAELKAAASIQAPTFRA